MKKSMLCAGLIAVLNTTGYAENNSGAPENINAIQIAAVPADAQAPQMPTTMAAPNLSGTQLASASAPSSTPSTTTTTQPNTTPTTTTTTTITTPAPAAAGTTAPTAPATGTATPATGTAAPATNPTAPAANTNTTTPAANTAPPANTTSTGASKTTSPTTTTIPTTPAPAAPASVSPPQPLNCNYRIPAETTHIDKAIVLKWAEKATEQSFDFDHTNMDNQLLALKSCYTEQGWQGFNDALQKSGNLNAIKSQQLTVSSMVNGEGNVTEIKDNQWKVTMPLQVVYQNDKEKLTQPLTVNLVVGRKVSGDLGIMQMIAVPRQTTTSGSSTQPQTSTTTTTQTPSNP